MPLEAVELPDAAARGRRIAGRVVLAPTATTASRTRSARPTATSSAASAASSRTRPTSSPTRVDESDVDAVLDWCADAGAAAIPYGGGTSVVGGVEPRVGDDYPGAVTIDLGASTGCSRSTPISRAARIQAGALGPGARGPAPRARADAAPLPAVVRVLDPRRLDRDPRRRPLRDPLHAHRRPRRVGAGVTPCGRWESRRLPGSGAGPSPDRLLLGSEGILGVITEAWVRVQERPRWKLSCGVAFDDFAAARRGGPRALAVRPLSRPTAACSTPVEAETHPAPGPPGKALLVLGFESADHPVDEPMRASRSRWPATTAASRARSQRGRREPGRASSAGGERRRRRLAQRLPRRPLPARHARRLGVLSDTFETAITWDRFDDFHAARDGDRAARGRRGRRTPRPRPGLAAGHLPLHPRLPGRPGALLHGPRPGPARRRARAVGRDQGGASRRR